ncbi:MAG: LutB/LldF family L-lactate oxidation iron-sulfur protein [Planctomycetota bacterium]
MNATVSSFLKDAKRVSADLRHRSLIQNALKGYLVKRDEKKAQFQDWQHARQTAAEIKWDAINHLDKYLAQFADNAEANGAKVFWASTADEAREYILDVAKKHNVKSIIKSKTMTGEEIHLGQALEKAHIRVVESDLGELIVQLREEPPYHIVFPSMHLSRHEISDLFQKKLGSEPTDQPEELTMIARRAIRGEYIKADMGISGANFAVAETGMISITENEGNARLSTGLPKVHVAICGIEKIVPRMEHLALFLPMLATAGAGQALTCYNSLIGGPRQRGEVDGPEEFHIVLLDNSRSALLADPEQRDALHCIRCGACLNVCPIFKNVGGHTYGTTYSGPIGSVITPHLRGLQQWKHLSQASSLCGACTETCPVKINLHHHLLHNRRNAVSESAPFIEKIAMKIFAQVATKPKLFEILSVLARFGDFFLGLVRNTVLDPLGAWTKTRSFPNSAPKNFKEMWRERAAKKEEAKR